MTFGKVAMWGVVGEEYRREHSEFAKKKKNSGPSNPVDSLYPGSLVY